MCHQSMQMLTWLLQFRPEKKVLSEMLFFISAARIFRVLQAVVTCRRVIFYVQLMETMCEYVSFSVYCLYSFTRPSAGGIE